MKTRKRNKNLTKKRRRGDMTVKDGQKRTEAVVNKEGGGVG